MQTDGVGKMERGEIVVVEDGMSVLCSEEVLRSVLAMAQVVKKPKSKKQ
jgi:hypothetical protein